MFGNLHAPGLQGRPFLVANEKRVGCFIERRARQFIATSADAPLYIRFARLVSPRRQSQMRADIPRFPEPFRPIDCRPKSQSRQRADARRAHQPTADWFITYYHENLLGEPFELMQHRAEDFEQRLDHRREGPLFADQFQNSSNEVFPRGSADFETRFTKDGPSTFSMVRISFKTARRATSSERQERHVGVFT